MKNRRKRYYIDSVVQGVLLRRIVLHWFIFFALASVLMPLWHVMQTATFSKPFGSLLIEGWKETLPVLLLLGAMLPIFVWDTLKLSHRFAGPMYRIHQTIRGLIAGEDFRPIRLRPGDFWKDMAADFNCMVQRLASQAAKGQPLPERDAADADRYGSDTDALVEANGSGTPKHAHG